MSDHILLSFSFITWEFYTKLTGTWLCLVSSALYETHNQIFSCKRIKEYKLHAAHDVWDHACTRKLSHKSSCENDVLVCRFKMFCHSSVWILISKHQMQRISCHIAWVVQLHAVQPSVLIEGAGKLEFVSMSVCVRVRMHTCARITHAFFHSRCMIVMHVFRRYFGMTGILCKSAQRSQE